MGSLEAHEIRLNRRSKTSTKNAFESKINLLSHNSKESERSSQEKYRNKNNQRKSNEYSPCCICKSKNHLEEGCWFKGKQQCQNCKKFGHTENTCRLKKNHQANFLE